jgi:sugar phosphate permease
MNRRIFFVGVVVGVIAITIYNFQGANPSSEGYAQKVEQQRLEKKRNV